MQCLSNLRQLGNAQQIYIGSAQGWGVPDLQGMATTEWPREQWNENPNFRRGIGSGLMSYWLFSGFPCNGRLAR